ncbi:MAG TPA: lysophospholipid acyltransferase family protein [bacterium]|jgi:KDO2-lipid IV(A) lauroyltransferase|nr:lysophospholipid acyltransferase family protein [bacterium]HOC88040.1 lysophospholipid acyltransferase family protein [bacterium]HOZ21047.1 lysophospholipid acyltransferase family protein [bacterium]
MKQIQNVIEYLLVQLAAFPIRLLPHRLALRLGVGLGSFVYHVIPIRRGVALQNISRSFPEKNTAEIRAICKKVYHNFGQNIIEFMRMPKMDDRFFREYISVVGGELLERAGREGRGAVCLSGHFGNWEFFPAVIHRLGFPMVGLARDQRNPLVNKLINQTRTGRGVELTQLGMGVRTVFRALAANKFVTILADQDAHKEGIFVDFLNRPSSTASGPALFALKTAAPLIFGVVIRGEKGRHTLLLEEVDHRDLQGVTPENIQELTQRHARLLEKYIRLHPDHWLWMHKRWKTSPPAGPAEDGNQVAQD